MSCGAPVESADRHFWERTIVVWHLIFAAGAVGATIEVVTADELTARQRTAALVVLGTLTLWYLAVGAAGLQRGEERRGYLYLAGMFPLFFTLVALDGNLAYLLFAVVPQVFIMVDSLLWAASCVTVLYLGVGALLAVQYEADDAYWGEVVEQNNARLLPPEPKMEER